jgi:RNA polymerase sigma factor (sigma-70 family)
MDGESFGRWIESHGLDCRAMQRRLTDEGSVESFDQTKHGPTTQNRRKIIFEYLLKMCGYFFTVVDNMLESFLSNPRLVLKRKSQRSMRQSLTRHGKNEMTTAILLAAKSGSTSAMSDLLVNTQRYASCVVYRFLGTKFQRFVDVEDLTQEVLIQVATTVADSTVQDYDQFCAWVAMVARNVVYKAVRKMKATKRQLHKVGSMAEGVDVLGNSVDPSDEVAIREELAAIMELAAGRGQYVHKVVTLISHGHKPEEIAAELNVTRDAVYSVMKRFRSTVCA